MQLVPGNWLRPGDLLSPAHLPDIRTLTSAPGPQNFNLHSHCWKEDMEETAGDAAGANIPGQSPQPVVWQKVLLHLAPLCHPPAPSCHQPLTGCSRCPWSLHLAGCSLAAPSSVQLPVPSPVLLYLQSPRMVFVALCLRPPGLELPEGRAWCSPDLDAEWYLGMFADRGLDACLLGLRLIPNDEGRSSEPARPRGTQGLSNCSPLVKGHKGHLK